MKRKSGQSKLKLSMTVAGMWTSAALMAILLFILMTEQSIREDNLISYFRFFLIILIVTFVISSLLASLQLLLASYSVLLSAVTASVIIPFSVFTACIYIVSLFYIDYSKAIDFHIEFLREIPALFLDLFSLDEYAIPLVVSAIFGALVSTLLVQKYLLQSHSSDFEKPQ